MQRPQIETCVLETLEHYSIYLWTSLVKPHLWLERLPGLQHMQQLRVVDFQQHSSDFASKVWVHTLNQREQPLTQHLLLLLGWGSGQHGGSQRLLAMDMHCLGWSLEIKVFSTSCFGIYIAKVDKPVLNCWLMYVLIHSKPGCSKWLFLLYPTQFFPSCTQTYWCRHCLNLIGSKTCTISKSTYLWHLCSSWHALWGRIPHVRCVLESSPLLRGTCGHCCTNAGHLWVGDSHWLLASDWATIQRGTHLWLWRGSCLAHYRGGWWHTVACKPNTYVDDIISERHEIPMYNGTEVYQPK